MSDYEDFQLDPVPPLTPGPSLEAEEQAMRGGRGGIIAFGVASVILLLVGVVYLFASGDENQAYETLGRNVNGAKTEFFDGFWMCIFGRTEEFANNEELTELIHVRATMGGAQFAPVLRDRCVPKLDELEPRLESLIPPDDMRAPTNELVLATRTLRGAVSDYLAYLEDLETIYDRDDAQTRVRQVARGWYEFRAAYAQLNDQLRDRL